MILDSIREPVTHYRGQGRYNRFGEKTDIIGELVLTQSPFIKKILVRIWQPKFWSIFFSILGHFSCTNQIISEPDWLC